MDVKSYREELRDALLSGGAVFRVIYVDPDGSGMDFRGHLGATIMNASRCCKRCTCIWGTVGHKEREIGPFVEGELQPVNYEASLVVKSIAQFKEEWRNRTLGFR